MDTGKTVTGETIATWRKSRGITQQQLAERIKMSIGTVRRWEQEPTAEVSGVTHDRIVDWAKKAGIKVSASQAAPKAPARALSVPKADVKATTKVSPKARKRPMLTKAASFFKMKPTAKTEGRGHDRHA